MPEEIKYLIIAALIIIAVLIVLSAIVGLIMRAAFKKRGDGSPAFRYLQAEDFPLLVADPIQFLSNKKQILRGYLYHHASFTSFKELIVFCHGIGAGHTMYTTEINRLAKEGFLVMGFDYTGCALSSGSEMKSLIQAIVDLDFAFRYIDSRPDLKILKRYVVGHSWGGFVALSSLLFKKHHVDKVVNISGFISQPSVIVSNRRYLCPLYPFFFMYGWWRYGRYATYNSLRALRKSEVPILSVQGKADRVIKPIYSNDQYAKIAKRKSNIAIYDVDDKGHLPYLTKRAEEYLLKVNVDKAIAKRGSPVVQYDIDYKLITEEDEVVMKAIVAFLKK